MERLKNINIKLNCQENNFEQLVYLKYAIDLLCVKIKKNLLNI